MPFIAFAVAVLISCRNSPWLCVCVCVCGCDRYYYAVHTAAEREKGRKGWRFNLFLLPSSSAAAIKKFFFFSSFAGKLSFMLLRGGGGDGEKNTLIISSKIAEFLRSRAFLFLPLFHYQFWKQVGSFSLFFLARSSKAALALPTGRKRHLPEAAQKQVFCV